MPELLVLSHRSGEFVPVWVAAGGCTAWITLPPAGPWMGSAGSQSRIINEARGKFQACVKVCCRAGWNRRMRHVT
jgi:hypothetical protein